MAWRLSWVSPRAAIERAGKLANKLADISGQAPTFTD
jgi:hypothetical protein